LLRRIRLSLIESGKFQRPASPAGRYLLYALGEIALVVIGILIALQVNEWNNNREKQNIELSTLYEFRSALRQDTTKIVIAKQRFHKSYDHTVALLNHIEDEKPYDKSLDTIIPRSYTFHTPTFERYNTAAFDLLKERGLDIISNENLRRDIINHYTNNHTVMNGWFANVQKVHGLQVDRLYGNFKIDQDMGERMKMYPNDYDQILRDRSTLNPFYHFKSLIVSSLNRFDKFHDETKELLASINKEIDSRE